MHINKILQHVFNLSLRTWASNLILDLMMYRQIKNNQRKSNVIFILIQLQYFIIWLFVSIYRLHYHCIYILIIFQQPIMFYVFFYNSNSSMLKYHRILGQPSQTKTAKFTHYLSLGSHQTVVNLFPLISFSLVQMHAGARFNISIEKQNDKIMNALIALDQVVTFGSNTCESNTIGFNCHQIYQQNNKATSFLYLQYESDYAQEKTVKFADSQQIKLSDCLHIKKLVLSSNKSLSLNIGMGKRIFIWIKTGKVLVNDTKQIFFEHQALYTKEKIDIQALQESEIFVIEFHDKQKH